MSTINFTKQRPASAHDRVVIASWAGLATGDDGTPIELSQFADRTVQASGAFGGGTVVIEGSVNGVDYKTLTDPQGNALSFTSASIEAIAEVVQFLRPRVTGGTGVAINVDLLLKG